jgi:hypothetical protein
MESDEREGHFRKMWDFFWVMARLFQFLSVEPKAANI